MWILNWNQIPVVIIITWSISTWLGIDTLPDKLNLMPYKNLKIHMMVCNLLICMWMNNAIRFSGYWVNSWQTLILIFAWIYGCECVCSIYIHIFYMHIFLCIFMQMEERTMWEPMMGEDGFVNTHTHTHICWHVNTCRRKGLC